MEVNNKKYDMHTNEHKQQLKLLSVGKSYVYSHWGKVLTAKSQLAANPG